MPGKERAFWSFFIRREMWDPSAATDQENDEQIKWLESPGGTHTILEVYRAKELDGEQNQPRFGNKLKIPVLAIGGDAFFGEEVRLRMQQAAENDHGLQLADCRHNPSLEMAGKLAEAYLCIFEQRTY